MLKLAAGEIFEIISKYQHNIINIIFYFDLIISIYSFSALIEEYQIFSSLTASSFPCRALKLRYSCEYGECFASSLSEMRRSSSINTDR